MAVNRYQNYKAALLNGLNPITLKKLPKKKRLEYNSFVKFPAVRASDRSSFDDWEIVSPTKKARKNAATDSDSWEFVETPQNTFVDGLDTYRPVLACNNRVFEQDIENRMLKPSIVYSHSQEIESEFYDRLKMVLLGLEISIEYCAQAYERNPYLAFTHLKLSLESLEKFYDYSFQNFDRLLNETNSVHLQNCIYLIASSRCEKELDDSYMKIMTQDDGDFVLL
jgi:hypothetical protein